MGLSIFDEQKPANDHWTIDAAYGTATYLSNTDSRGPSRYDQIWVANSDTIPHVVGLSFMQSSVACRLGGVSVPAGAGWGATPAIELLSSILGALNTGIVVSPNELVGVNVDVTMLGASECRFSFFAGSL